MRSTAASTSWDGATSLAGFQVSTTGRFWVSTEARAYGLGVGWVSILDPSDVTEILEVPTEWSLVTYLCVGYPQEEHVDPELERYGWQTRDDRSRLVLRR